MIYADWYNDTSCDDKSGNDAIMGSERNERVRLFKVRLRGQFIETLY